MKVAYLKLTVGILGLLVGANVGLYIPIYHAPPFLREVLVLPSFFGGVWEYELWGNVIGILLALATLSRFGAGLAVLFGIGYALAFSAIILARAPGYHGLLATLIGSISAVVVAVLTAKVLAASIVYSLSNYSLDRKRWASWALPTRAGLVLGALGTIGLLISVLGWFGIQPYNIIPGIEGPRSEVLRFPYRGSIVELHGMDGLSIARPIQILGARESNGGVPSEYHWIKTYYPHHHRSSQVVIKMPTRKVVSRTIRHSEGRQAPDSVTTIIPSRCFDMIELQDWLGRRSTLFFDITDFFKCDEFDSSHPTGMTEELQPY